MSIYLIDFENVHYDGLSGILNLTADDEVYIFYSDNGKRLTFELHEQIINSQAKFYYYKADVGGKNALDHQLSTYLGFLVGKKEEKQYYIVSKDQGFRYLATFWKSANLGLEITLVDSIKISRQDNQAVSGTGVSAQPEAQREQVETETALTKGAKTKKRGQRGKIKLEPEAIIEPSALADKDLKPINQLKKIRAVKPQKSAKAKTADETAMTNVEAKAGAFVNEVTAADDGEKEKAMPKVIEFVLPSEVISAAFADRQSTTKAVARTEEKTQWANESPVKPKPGKAKPAKIDKAETDELANQKERAVFSEEDILALIPEAKEQGWLADIIRYLNITKGKADLYNMIRRRLGQDKGREIYNRLKKLIQSI